MKTVFDDLSKTEEFVLPSGIRVVLKEPMGSHQSLITKSDTKKRKNGIQKMLKECIVRLGDASEVIDKVYPSLLASDVQFMLFKLGLLSSPTYGKDKVEELRFKYEFPTKGGQRISQMVEIDISPENFPMRPYCWVADEMYETYRNSNGIDERNLTDKEKELAILEDYPVIYESYSEMLEEQKERTFTFKELPDTEVTWHLLDVEGQKKVGRTLDHGNQDVNTVIRMRSPKYELEVNDPKEGGTKFITSSLPVDKIPSHMLEELRVEILNKVEASIDTLLVIGHDEDPTLQSQVDLVQTPAFFFRSLGQ